MSNKYVELFIDTAKKVGAEVTQLSDLQEAVSYIQANSSGRFLVPQTTLSQNHDLNNLLEKGGIDVFPGDFREAGQVVGGGVTFCNFCLADSGTVVLESTAEDIRLATTLAEKHFVLVDPDNILKDNLAAAQPMSQLHSGNEPIFVAYITGPSRTADIERVLTIGCHGPRELHILLVNNISTDLLEN